MKFKLETGTIIIMVLIVSTSLSVCALYLLKQLFLTQKTSSGFQNLLLNDLKAALHVQQSEEAQLHKHQACDFVADHLEFGCSQGIYLIKVNDAALQSYISIRNE